MSQSGFEGYWWVEIELEFLPGKMITGIVASPCFTDKSIAEKARIHLEQEHGIRAKLESSRPAINQKCEETEALE